MAIQDAINLIKTACTQWSLGYDQANRLDFRNGGETSCSALVILTCEQAGLLPGNNIRKNMGATFTGNMRANFKARSWRVLPNLPVSRLRPGRRAAQRRRPHGHVCGEPPACAGLVTPGTWRWRIGRPDRERDLRPLLLQLPLVVCPALPRSHNNPGGFHVLNKGQDAITPIALPNDIKVVRFFSDQPAQLAVDTREKDNQ